MGAAGAGKSRIGSALAAALDVRFIEGDAFHPPANVAMMAAGIPLTDATRHGWLLALAAELRAARDASHGVVLACSALKRHYRDLLRGGDPTIRFVFLHGDASLLRDRLGRRHDHFMPATLIDDQLDTLEPPTPDEQPIVCDAANAPDVILTQIMTALGAAGEGNDP